GVRYGKNVRAFLDGLVTRGLADRFVVRADRGHVYHLHARAVYAAIGEDEHRHRRPSGPAQIARKLMLLDVVVRRQEATWVATPADKVDLFVSGFGVPLHACPSQAASGQTAEVRYF